MARHHGCVDFMRALRLVWVLLTNGTAIYVLYTGTRQDVLLNTLLEQENRNKALWFHFALWAAIPVLGIVLEVCRSRFAKWLNLGYFVCFAIVFSAIGILNLPDDHALISLLFGIVALIFSCVSYLLYRKRKPAPIASTVSSR
jgi:predicted membrane channel-forming protein YqfA (hemolysin III family)